MSISTFEPSMVDSQSMINGQYNFWYGNGSVQWTSYPHNLQPRSSKTSGLELLPTQLNAQCNCLPPFQPYQPLQSEQDSLVPPFSHLWYRRLESGVGAELKKGKWAEQLGRRWRNSRCSANAWWWWWIFCGWETIVYSSSAKIASQSLFLECKFKSLSGRIYQMSYSVFPANLWVQI